MNHLTWLQDWYSSMCNGDWEHQNGIEISTIDNPGWHLRISLKGLRPLKSGLTRTRERESDWLQCAVKEDFFEASGGPTNLNDMLGVFREWIEPQQHSIEIEGKQ
jgi:hypothetical protein